MTDAESPSGEPRQCDWCSGYIEENSFYANVCEECSEKMERERADEEEAERNPKWKEDLSNTPVRL